MSANEATVETTSVAVVGFIAFDHAMGVKELPKPGSGVLIDRRLTIPWPRLGGAGANAARAVSAQFGKADLVSRVGRDDAGARALVELGRVGIGIDGLTVDSGRTAAAWLFYDRRGNSVTFMDPGTVGQQQLLEPQRQILRRARWICIAAGPPEIARSTLDTAGQRAKILWIVKADPMCFPPSLASRLATRADVVVLNSAETTFIPIGKLNGSVVITDGVRPIRYRHDGRWAEERVDAAHAHDTTGAGDAFAGALAARLNAAPLRDFGESITAAKNYARAFLIGPSSGTS